MFFKSWYVDVFTVTIFSFIIRIKKLITHLFKRLVYEIQNNLHQLTTHMSTLITWHNRFSENKNEAVEAHIPRHRDSKTKKPRHRVSAEFWPLCPLIGTLKYGTPAEQRSNAGTMEHHWNNGTPPEQSKHRRTAEHYDRALAE